MRILMIVLSPSVGGAETIVGGLAADWRRLGHDVDVLALDQADPASPAGIGEALFGQQFTTARQNRSSWFPQKQISRLVGLKRAMRRKTYDVLYASTAIPNMYSRLATIGKRHAPPVVIALHAARNDYQNVKLRVAERMLVRRTAGVLAVSGRIADEYKDSMRLPLEKLPLITVVANGVPTVARARGDRPQGLQRVIALSRIVPQKDIETMLIGFDLYLKVADRQITLQIAGPIGTDPYGTQIRRVHSLLAHSDQIQLLGARMDRHALLANGDLFLHTAVAEGHAVAVLEAAAAGVPILASDILPIRETLGEAGWYFKVGDPASLAKGLQIISSNWTEALNRAQLLAEEIGKKHSMTSCAAAHLAFLDAATSSRERARQRGSRVAIEETPL